MAGAPSGATREHVLAPVATETVATGAGAVHTAASARAIEVARACRRYIWRRRRRRGCLHLFAGGAGEARLALARALDADSMLVAVAGAGVDIAGGATPAKQARARRLFVRVAHGLGQAA